MRYWQHGETGRLAKSGDSTLPDYTEISRSVYDAITATLPTSMPVPAHGDRRNERIEQSVHNLRTLRTSTGQEIQTPLFATSESVSERWCATCGAWVEARGIIGGLVCQQCNTAWRPA